MQSSTSLGSPNKTSLDTIIKTAWKFIQLMGIKCLQHKAAWAVCIQCGAPFSSFPSWNLESLANVSHLQTPSALPNRGNGTNHSAAPTKTANLHWQVAVLSTDQVIHNSHWH